MSFRLNNDGDFTVNDDNEIISIGRIGGTFIPEKNPVSEEKYRNWVEECANIIKPCSHTIQETEQFFLQHCEALPIPKDDYRMKRFQYSVVKILKYRLENKISDVSINMSDEAILKFHKDLQEAKMEVMNNSPEYYGIHLSGYYLPRTKRNSSIYEETNIEIKELMIKYNSVKMSTNNHVQEQCIYVFFEKTTEHIECNGSGRSLSNKLIAFKGVNEEDIRLRNTRFFEYIHSMREPGYLTDFCKERFDL